MKRIISSAILCAGVLPVVAVTSNDSIDVVLGEARVIATRATQTTPIAFTNITREQLQHANHGPDIPYLVT